MGCGSSKFTEESDDPELDVFPVPQFEDGYPPPRPPRTNKADCFKPEDYTTIDSTAKQVPDSKTVSYEILIGEITKDLTTDIQKLRAIYIWLGHQPIEDQSYPNVTDNRTPRGYMKNIKHGKGSFTAFFALLCRAAKLPCVILYGKGKSAGYEVGTKEFTDLNSQWNTVYVDGSWRIVHALWSFRALSGFSLGNWTAIERDGVAVHSKEKKSTGKDISHLNEYYFLTDPAEFIYKCRPEKDPWQLLQSPWSMDKYTSVPYCRPSFFSSGLKLVSENNCILKSEKGKCWIEFEHPETIEPQMDYQFFYNEEASGNSLPSDRQLNMYIAYNNETKKKGYVVRFPCVGVYKIDISGFIEFRLECPEIGNYIQEFPVNPAIGYGYGKTAQSLGVVSVNQISGILRLQGNQTKVFKFEIPEPDNVKSEFIGNTGENLNSYINQSISGNNVSVEITMPDMEGDYMLQLYKENENAINYLVTTDNVDKSDDSDKPQDKDLLLRSVLIKATAEYDAKKLQSAIDNFEENGLEDRGDLTKAKQKLQELNNAQQKDSNKEARIRERLRLATSENDIGELEDAIEEFLANRLKDEGDLIAAKERLIELYTKALEKETQERNVDRLETIIDRAKNCRVCRTLTYSQAMRDAEETLRQLQRLKKYMTKILKMRQSTVSEITSYKRPKPCIHDIMKATFFVLGEKEKQLSTWEQIQSLTKKLGKDSLIRRIKEYDVINLKIPVANKSEKMLEQYDDAVVRQTSAGAGTFYKWSSNIINEAQGNDPRRREK